MKKRIVSLLTAAALLLAVIAGAIEAWMQSNRVATDDELEQQAQTIARKGGRK